MHIPYTTESEEGGELLLGVSRSEVNEDCATGPNLASDGTGGAVKERFTNATDLQRFFQELLERAGTIDIGSYENCEREHLEEGLLPELRELLSEEASGLSAVREYYDSESAPGSISDRVSDVAILASWEVQQKLQSLDVGQDEVCAILAACARAHRVVFKSGIAVERAICDREGFQTALDTLSVTTLHRSLRIRLMYSSLRKEIENGPLRDQEDPYMRLRQASESLERLARSRIYGDIRITDRLEFTKIRANIAAWLGGRDEHNPVSGRRLWQDLVAFSDLLRQINHRDVLREYDAVVVCTAQRALFNELRTEDHVADAILIRLRLLWGRDPELDSVIEDAREFDAQTWEKTLERVSKTLCARESELGTGELSPNSASLARDETVIGRSPFSSVTISTINEACKKLLVTIAGGLACGVVDLYTGLPLGVYNAIENTEARNECFAAAAAELFGGSRVQSLPWMAPSQPGHDYDEYDEPFPEVYLASKNTSLFARVIKNGDASLVLVTQRSVSVGMASAALRAAVRSMEPLVP